METNNKSKKQSKTIRKTNKIFKTDIEISIKINKTVYKNIELVFKNIQTHCLQNENVKKSKTHMKCYNKFSQEKKDGFVQRALLNLVNSALI